MVRSRRWVMVCAGKIGVLVLVFQFGWLCNCLFCCLLENFCDHSVKFVTVATTYYVSNVAALFLFCSLNTCHGCCVNRNERSSAILERGTPFNSLSIGVEMNNLALFLFSSPRTRTTGCTTGYTAPSIPNVIEAAQPINRRPFADCDIDDSLDVTAQKVAAWNRTADHNVPVLID